MTSPAGSEHGRIAMRFGSLLDQYVRKHQLGTVFAAETGFLISTNPDTVRAPDVAFVEKKKMEQFAGHQGFLPIAPDLVVEVVSPNDSFTHVEEKTLAWLEAGSAMVVNIDPGTRTLQVFRDAKHSVVLRENDQFDGQEVVSGWQFVVSELFE